MMGVREWMDTHRGATTAIVVLLVLLAVGAIVAQVMANRKAYPSGMPDSYFTIDDGKTFFVAGSENIPPFDYKGQPAVHAYVFQCGGKKFVGYMDRYTPEARSVDSRRKAYAADRALRPGNEKARRPDLGEDG